MLRPKTLEAILTPPLLPTLLHNQSVRKSTSKISLLNTFYHFRILPLHSISTGLSHHHLSPGFLQEPLHWLPCQPCHLTLFLTPKWKPNHAIPLFKPPKLKLFQWFTSPLADFLLSSSPNTCYSFLFYSFHCSHTSSVALLEHNPQPPTSGSLHLLILYPQCLSLSINMSHSLFSSMLGYHPSSLITLLALKLLSPTTYFPLSLLYFSLAHLSPRIVPDAE